MYREPMIVRGFHVKEQVLQLDLARKTLHLAQPAFIDPK